MQSVSGLLMDIRRFTVHDGPGIRTTLFLKGCPLKCLWCHNPEGILPTPQLAFHDHKCLHCGECVKICSTGAHRMHNGRHEFLPQRCNACAACEDACPGAALHLFGKPASVQETAATLLEDRLFYQESGGGVTLSGGEPLLQSPFCRALLEAMQHEGIHTAMDTCGFAPWEAFLEVLPFTSLFLFDIKHADSTMHRKLTGQGNELILDNLKKLCAAKAPIEVRIPLVPGCNDSPDNLRHIGELLKGLPLQKVRLLRYHSLARSKYAALNMPDTMPPAEPIQDSHMRQISDNLHEYTNGIPIVSTP